MDSNEPFIMTLMLQRKYDCGTMKYSASTLVPLNPVLRCQTYHGVPILLLPPLIFFPSCLFPPLSIYNLSPSLLPSLHPSESDFPDAKMCLSVSGTFC